MTPLTLLRSLGLTVRHDGGRLLVSPRVLMTDDCRDYVRAFRAEILLQLEMEEAGRLHADSREGVPVTPELLELLAAVREMRRLQRRYSGLCCRGRQEKEEREGWEVRVDNLLAEILGGGKEGDRGGES